MHFHVHFLALAFIGANLVMIHPAMCDFAIRAGNRGSEYDGHVAKSVAWPGTLLGSEQRRKQSLESVKGM